jgi:hypothetical protein
MLISGPRAVAQGTSAVVEAARFNYVLSISECKTKSRHPSDCGVKEKLRGRMDVKLFIEDPTIANGYTSAVVKTGRHAFQLRLRATRNVAITGFRRILRVGLASGGKGHQANWQEKSFDAATWSKLGSMKVKGSAVKAKGTTLIPTLTLTPENTQAVY